MPRARPSPGPGSEATRSPLQIHQAELAPSPLDHHDINLMGNALRDWLDPHLKL